jgi:predicted restriction endonuclease
MVMDPDRSWQAGSSHYVRRFASEATRQPDFRNGLIEAYGGRCAVTGCDAVAALEAAHIVPYTGTESQQISNGLLLRADIHTLFDLDLICIDPRTLAVALAAVLHGTSYADLDGRGLSLPQNPADHPSREALALRWERIQTQTQ